MNHRIRELEDQCWVKVPCDFDMRKGGLSTINTVFDRKKFAELLIRECVGLVNLQLQHNNPNDSLLALKIKEHFGVEE